MFPSLQHGLPPEQEHLATSAQALQPQAAAPAVPLTRLSRTSCASRSADGVLLSPFCSGAQLPAFVTVASPRSTDGGATAAADRKAASARPPRPARDSVRSLSAAEGWPAPNTPDRGSLESAGAAQSASTYRLPPIPSSGTLSSVAARLAGAQLPELASAFAAAALSRASSLGASCDLSTPATTAALSELINWVRHQEAEEAAAGGKPGNSDGSSHMLLRCGSSVPTRLREWLVDPADVEYLHHPGTNRLVELGAGARWALGVRNVWCSGVPVACLLPTVPARQENSMLCGR